MFFIQTIVITNAKCAIFSPKKEVDFAGHPIIATAYVLGLCGDIALTEAITPIVLEQNVGPIDVNISVDDGKPTFVQFARTVVSIVDRFAPTDEELASFLGIKQSELDHKKYSPRLVSCGFPYLIVRSGIMKRSEKPNLTVRPGANPSHRKQRHRKFCCLHPKRLLRIPILMPGC